MPLNLEPLEPPEPLVRWHLGEVGMVPVPRGVGEGVVVTDTISTWGRLPLECSWGKAFRNP